MNRLKKASYIQQIDGQRLQCQLCPHLCILAEDQWGICRVRVNRGGVVYASAYGRVSSLAIDPIEKKPLYHYYPASQILSIGSFGCNLQCRCCQNWQISQSGPGEGPIMQPHEIVNAAVAAAGNLGIAYTYNEPLINFEFVIETARLAATAHLKNVLVSNGFINQAPLAELISCIDAFNVDLKGFSETFYRQFTGSSLQPVLRTLSDIRKSGRHLELTMLVIPGENDHPGDFAEMIKWISGELGNQTVLHLSRYFPKYRHDARATPHETMIAFYQMAVDSLPFVYLGNMSVGHGSNTICPDCGSTVVNRQGYVTDASGLDDAGNCRRCRAALPFVV